MTISVHPCDLDEKMKAHRRWLTDEELKPGMSEPGIALSVFPETLNSDVTQVDFFAAPGTKPIRF